MIVVFLVDTSVSMNQKFSNGMSAFECAKSAIEHLVKHLPQIKPIEKHNDKYVLATYEDGPGCIKSSLKDPLSHLIKELKVLKATDMSNPGAALATVFELLNAYRVYHGLDSLTSGRFPGSIEPTIILWFTDGGRQSTSAGVLERMNIPGITSAGMEYYQEPFRWDQRLYTIFMEPSAEVLDPQLSMMSGIMGGACYRVWTLRHMLQAMDCMLGISKVPPTQHSPQALVHIYGVVVNFEDLSADSRRPPNTANHHQLVYVNPSWLAPQTRHPGFFPIPEPNWPDPEAIRLSPRSAQPTLHYHTKDDVSVDIPEGFPYDKYVVAPCPMTQELLTRPPGTTWPVFMKNSYKTEGFGFPFGFLKANTHKNAVTLSVVAYNYPALFTLLKHLSAIPGRVPTQEWTRDFAEYLSHTPSYYIVPLKNALKRMGLYNIVQQDRRIPPISPVVVQILNKNKMAAKIELERIQSVERPLAFSETVGGVATKKPLCTNAFDIPRSDLVSALTELKKAFFKDLCIAPQAFAFSSSSSPLTLNLSTPTTRHASNGPKVFPALDPDELHTMPVADMGNYQERMQRIQKETLRDPFRDEETTKSLQRTMFGNPYKKDSKKISIDEDGEASAADSLVSNTSGSSTTSGGSSVSVSSNGTSNWSAILGRKRKPRRRSISPAPYPFEKIPALSVGYQRGSGSALGTFGIPVPPAPAFSASKAQVLVLGAEGAVNGGVAVLGNGNLPILRILVQDGRDQGGSNGNHTPSSSTFDGLGALHVMRDGEDEGDDDSDDYRRAMFNSDEMMGDGEDDTSRLRADTPMPGAGIGVDQDDEDGDAIMRDIIPPPIIPVTLQDIEAEFEEQEGHKNSSGLLRRPSSSNSSTTGMIGLGLGLVATELSDIPSSGGGSGTLLYGPEVKAITLGLESIPPLLSSSDSERSGKGWSSSNKRLGLDSNQASDSAVPLAPVPVLASLQIDRSSQQKEGIAPFIGGSRATKSSHSTTNQANGGSSTLTIQDENLLHGTLGDTKMYIIQQLRQTSQMYNEQRVVRTMWQVEMALQWTKDQKLNLLSACLYIARAFRRTGAVAIMEQIQERVK